MGSTAVFEKQGWYSLGKASEHGVQMGRILLGLPIRNGERLSSLFDEVSNPSSASYGAYLTKSELSELIAPSKETVEVVLEWLATRGATDVELLASNEYVEATLPLQTIEKEFAVEVHLWDHPLYHQRERKNEMPRLAATTLPLIPKELSSVVEIVSGLRDLPLSLTEKRQHAARSSKSASPAALASGAPLITDLLASQDHVFITLTPYCTDGSTTQEPLGRLCLDHPPALLGFEIATRNVVTGAINTVFVDGVNATSTDYFAWMTCTTNPKQPTTCVLAVPEQPYRTVTVNVTSFFYQIGLQGSNNFYGTAILLSDWVSPQLLRKQYNLPLGFNLPATSNRQAIASFSEQYWSSRDLTQFGQQLGIPIPQVVTLGYNNFNNPGDEAQLDITWITSMGQNIPTSFFSTTGGYLLEWAAKVLNQEGSDFPLVNSISYSDNEDDLTSQYGPNWADRVDSDFQKIAIRGGSVVVAAGDAGATNIGHGATSCSVFVPQYPASSAFVTSVGATGLSPSAQNLCGSLAGPYGPVPCTSPLLEIVVAGDNGFEWTTGGGVSNRTSRPYWQAIAVNQYLTALGSLNAIPPANLWNPTGRFYPDIAAVGSNLIVIQDGQLTIAAGTSASTPITAGIFASINAVLLSNGKQPLGFANPLLYSALTNAPGSFTDVTVGDNKCGDVLHPPHQLCCPNGWTATVGFDAASGVGSIDFSQLVHYAMQQAKDN